MHRPHMQSTKATSSRRRGRPQSAVVGSSSVRASLWRNFLLAELIDLGAVGKQMCDDTLGDPFEKEERIPGCSGPFRIRAAANNQGDEAATLVIGTRHSRRRRSAAVAGWKAVRQNSPRYWRIGSRVRVEGKRARKHLRNLYIYFGVGRSGRFRQGSGTPTAAHGMVGFIRFGLLNGLDSEKMRAELAGLATNRIIDARRRAPAGRIARISKACKNCCIVLALISKVRRPRPRA